MSKLIVKPILFFLSSIWIFIASIISIFIYFVVTDTYFENNTSFLTFYYGIFAYLMSMLIVKPQKYRMLNFFFHELSNALFSFFKINTFVVNKDSNSFISCENKKSIFSFLYHSHITALSPYFFYPLTILLIVIYLIILSNDNSLHINYLFNLSSSYQLYFKFLIGFTYAYHFITSIGQISSKQSEFNNLGFIYVLIFIFMMKLFFMLVILIVLSWELNSYIFILTLEEELYYLLNQLLDINFENIFINIKTDILEMIK